MEIKIIKKDVLIIGGGTAGCYAAGKLSEMTNLSIVIAEKANIKRSGCLAAGVNALNAYITPGHTPEDYVEYAKKDANGIVREDLLLTLSEKLNFVTRDLEKMGLTILKDENGNYVSRGWRNLKINGENIKPLLSEYAQKSEKVLVLDHVNVTDFLTYDDNGKKTIRGAVGFDTDKNVFYILYAGSVLITTGGAAGLYRPNNPGPNAHKMWYCPFNTGAGFAMGLKAGAEMTTFEMRFIALRCKDTLAPTGTIAQGVGAPQVNSKGEDYGKKYGNTTSERVWGTVEERKKGNGPCYLETKGISEKQEHDLYLAYLNMAPMQTLKWLGRRRGPAEENVEIDGSEPYVLGGHTAGGYWVSTERETTIKGLYTAGDACGGAPQKYVTGALAEALIVAERLKKLEDEGKIQKGVDGFADFKPNWDEIKLLIEDEQARQALKNYEKFLTQRGSAFTVRQVEEAMQKVMDEWAGGIKTSYSYNAAGLDIADRKIDELTLLAEELHAEDRDDLLAIYELRERLVVSKALIAHLRARKETRWHSFQENTDYPETSPEYELYINSEMKDGKIRIIKRKTVGRKERYEHTD